MNDELNRRAPAQPEPAAPTVVEPVAWVPRNKKTGEWIWDDAADNQLEPIHDACYYKQAVYAHPPRAPLTNDEIVDIWATCSDPYSPDMSILKFARAVEHSRGISVDRWQGE